MAPDLRRLPREDDRSLWLATCCWSSWTRWPVFGSSRRRAEVSVSDSRTFLPTTCPECAGHKVTTSSKGGYGPHVCELCQGKGVVSHFVAAAWFSEHPEAERADTLREFPAVTLDDSNKGERGP